MRPQGLFGENITKRWCGTGESVAFSKALIRVHLLAFSIVVGYPSPAPQLIVICLMGWKLNLHKDMTEIEFINAIDCSLNFNTKEEYEEATRIACFISDSVPGVAPSQVTVKIVNIVKIHAYRGQYGIF